MAVTFKQGDMFAEPADAIVNTVNCVGVMGKGVALEFKRRWPANFEEYKRLCDRKALRPGKVFVYQNSDMLDQDSWKFLVNFPTKDHWRGKSQIGFIDEGLDDFLAQVEKLGIRSVVLPPLGCGNGGLEWKEVKPLLVRKLSPVDGVEFLVFEPSETGKASGSVNMEMNFERAVLIKSFGDLTDYFGGSLTRIVMQKIVYFLQAMGVDYRMAFARNEFGPYSDDLRAVFSSMEKKNVLKGFSSETRETTVVPEAYKLADEFLQGDERRRAEEVINRASLLFEGYESPYGMELLSSVHFLADHEKISDVSDIQKALSGWNAQKGEKFSSDIIGIAYSRLREDRMIH
ncbi:type II toxin-antitoxin system antitoxin DNA ADP-ribosyl glycohydrolase DarG [Agrobacterium pusense]|uniref:type II toxin-antitoxin system antitoxin DNA ADP-ribosyl glycohydrolase DarG n=1 Tax=Agrobacterium pusense TaxID=648995 RepID=UPI002446CB54|nr:macro domain-containing protein [Agrobacterium pusense]MDH0869818.1 macro domain-containing protein [Agrobacterium pusense]